MRSGSVSEQLVCYHVKCLSIITTSIALQWRHYEHDGVSNHRRLDGLLNGHRLKKTSKLRVTGLCEGNSQVTVEFSSQRASNTENVSIWWHHHGITSFQLGFMDQWRMENGSPSFSFSCVLMVLSISKNRLKVKLVPVPFDHDHWTICCIIGSLSEISQGECLYPWLSYWAAKQVTETPPPLL